MAKRRKNIGRPKGRSSRKRKRSLRFSSIVVLALVCAGLWWIKHDPQLRHRYDLGRTWIATYYRQVEGRWQGTETSLFDSNPDFIASTSDSLVLGGIPHATLYPYPITVLENDGFVIGYCDHKKNPIWVSYRVFPVDVARGPPRPSRFSTDDRTFARVKHEDYTHSGYDRGHMAPNYAIATRYGAEAQRQSFSMSNVAPQLPRLNRGLWRQLEERIAKRWSNRYPSLWVFVGPIFTDPDNPDLTFEQPPQHLSSRVAVPIAFYQIIVANNNGTLETMSFIIPQEIDGSESLETFLTTIEAIEKCTGLNFFHELDRLTEEQLESFHARFLWN